MDLQTKTIRRSASGVYLTRCVPFEARNAVVFILFGRKKNAPLDRSSDQSLSSRHGCLRVLLQPPTPHWSSLEHQNAPCRPTWYSSWFRVSIGRQCWQSGWRNANIATGLQRKQGASRKRCKGSKIKRKEVLALQSCLSRCCALPECSSVMHAKVERQEPLSIVQYGIHIESHTSNEPSTNMWSYTNTFRPYKMWSKHIKDTS